VSLQTAVAKAHFPTLNLPQLWPSMEVQVCRMPVLCPHSQQNGWPHLQTLGEEGVCEGAAGRAGVGKVSSGLRACVRLRIDMWKCRWCVGLELQALLWNATTPPPWTGPLLDCVLTHEVAAAVLLHGL
jgi:hypothetical protein